MKIDQSAPCQDATQDPDGVYRHRPAGVQWPADMAWPAPLPVEVHPLGCFDCGTTLVVHKCLDGKFRCGPCIHAGAPLNFR